MVKYVANRAGLREVLASTAAARLVSQHAERIAGQCGDGFVASQRMGKTRQRAIVFPDTWSAKHRDARENVMVRVLG